MSDFIESEAEESDEELFEGSEETQIKEQKLCKANDGM